LLRDGGMSSPNDRLRLTGALRLFSGVCFRTNL
jgi:hypothetical protein